VAVAQLSPFARLLRRYRLDRHLTQEELAERAGLSSRAISDLERGVKIRPHRVTVELIADALSLTAEERSDLLSSVPRTASLQSDSSPLPPWLDAAVQRRPPAVDPAPCPPQLRQILDGLVALYVDEDKRDRQINVTVVMFSVGES
jgi:transcriptional regulator with XRE-family HTH domain